MRRNVLVAAVAGLVVAALPAAASPTPGCALLTDPTGDTSATPLAQGEPALDLVSARAGAVRDGLAVELQVAGLGSTDARTASGRTYGVELTVADRRGYSLVAQLMPDGDSFHVYGPDTSESPEDPPQTRNSPFLGDIAGVVDTQRSVIRFVVPHRLVLMAPGMRVRLTHADAARAVGLAGAGLLPSQASNTTSTANADEMDGDGTYVYGARSCVR